jgi:hypothetical protein
VQEVRFDINFQFWPELHEIAVFTSTREKEQQNQQLNEKRLEGNPTTLPDLEVTGEKKAEKGSLLPSAREHVNGHHRNKSIH